MSTRLERQFGEGVAIVIVLREQSGNCHQLALRLVYRCTSNCQQGSMIGAPVYV